MADFIFQDKSYLDVISLLDINYFSPESCLLNELYDMYQIFTPNEIQIILGSIEFYQDMCCIIMFIHNVQPNDIPGVFINLFRKVCSKLPSEEKNRITEFIKEHPDKFLMIPTNIFDK